jgi:DNA polymerase-3 subunit delta
MKLDARRRESFLRDPGNVRAALLYGDDVGMIRDYGARLTRSVAGSLDDPFRVVELGQDVTLRLVGEMATLPLNGGRRVVRVRDAGDSLAAAVAQALAGGGPGFLVLEAPGLTARSRLRALAEQAADAAAIACYPLDPSALAGELRAALQDRHVAVDAEALRWLQDRLGGDTAVTRSEVEKLALYAGAGGQVDLAAAQACVGDLAGLSLDDALFAATAGDVAATDRSLELALSEGAAPVAVVRAGLAHMQRLHRAALMMDGGLSAAEAARAARPPVFFRREPAFKSALALWPETALVAASARLWEADRGCKRTGAPAETIARTVIFGLAQRAAAAHRRRDRV